MTLITASSWGVTPAWLFKLCRRALGMSIEEMQDALCILDRNTVLRIERGRIDVQGPTWVSLGFMLRDTDLGDEESNTQLDDLAKQVEEYCKAIRKAAGDRRLERDNRHDDPPEDEPGDIPDAEGNPLNFAADPL